MCCTTLGHIVVVVGVIVVDDVRLAMVWSVCFCDIVIIVRVKQKTVCYYGIRRDTGLLNPFCLYSVLCIQVVDVSGVVE